MDDEIEEEETSTEKNSRIFSTMKKDFKAAEKAKKGIDELISEWNDAYYGKSKVSSGNTRSKIVMKEIAKQIEMQKPNITEPFLSTSNPIKVTDTGVNGIDGSHLERYSNNHFTSRFNRDDFINELVDVLLREGTVWVRDGWEHSESIETVEFTGSMEEILMNPEDPSNITQNEDGTFSTTYKRSVVDKNEATSRVCRNEYCFPDPGARNSGEMRFFCEERMLTISELRAAGHYDEADIDEIVSKIDENKDSSSSGLKSQRDDDALEYGYDKNYQPDDDPRKKISIVEYWGFMDVDGDGIAEPILGAWAKNEDVFLGVEETPMPSKKIPYNNTVYSSRPFSLWGNALAYFIIDNQRAKTGIVRGVLDNMSLANNGQKFIKTGTLDYVNFKRMRNGERHIIVNKSDGIQDGAFNQLPGSIFNVLSMFNQETEQIGGVSSNSPSLEKGGIAKDDSSATSLTMSQQRMVSIVRNISNLIGKSVHNWITMAEVFLTNEQIEELFSEQDTVEYNAFKGSSKSRVALKVGTSAARIIAMQQLNMLLQQSKALGETVPPNTFNALVAEMFELFDMYEKAEELRNYKPQPSPQRLEMQSMEMTVKKLEVTKLQAEISSMQVKDRVDMMNAEAAIMTAQSASTLNQNKSVESAAKAEGIQVDSALKPAQIVADIQEKQDRKNTEQERRTI